jgi:hypothetical protein
VDDGRLEEHGGSLEKPIIIDDDPSPNHRQERSTAGSNDRSDRGASEDLQDLFTAWDEDNVRQEIITATADPATDFSESQKPWFLQWYVVYLMYSSSRELLHNTRSFSLWSVLHRERDTGSFLVDSHTFLSSSFLRLFFGSYSSSWVLDAWRNTMINPKRVIRSQ